MTASTYWAETLREEQVLVVQSQQKKLSTKGLLGDPIDKSPVSSA